MVSVLVQLGPRLLYPLLRATSLLCTPWLKAPTTSVSVSLAWLTQSIKNYYFELSYFTASTKQTCCHIQHIQHTYLHNTYIHTYLHTYLRTYIIPTYLNTYLHIYLHYIHTYVQTYMNTYIHKYIPTYTHTYTHIPYAERSVFLGLLWVNAYPLPPRRTT